MAVESSLQTFTHQKNKGKVLQRQIRLWFVLLLIFCSIALPGIRVPGLFLIRPEELLLLICGPFFLLSKRLRLTIIDLGLVLVGVSTLISMIWGSLALGVSVVPRDAMEFIKIGRAWLLFQMTFYSWTERELHRIVKVFFLSVVLAAALGIVEWFNLGGVRPVIEAIYMTGTGNVSTGRMTGTVGNANYYGLLMAMGGILALNWWKPSKHRLLLIGVAGACGLALLLTLSRSAVLTMALGAVGTLAPQVPRIKYVSTWRFIKRHLIQIGIAFVLLVAGGIWLFGEFQKTNNMDPGAAKSYGKQNVIYQLVFRLARAEAGLNTRIEYLWKPTLETIQESPWLGVGPGKAEFRTVTDNGYLLTWRRYGVVGLALFLWLIGTVAWELMRVMKRYRRDSVFSTWALALMAILLGLLGANLFMEVFYNLQLMSLFWLLVGIGVAPAFAVRTP